MSNVRELKETGIPYSVTTELDQPIILERNGEPIWSPEPDPHWRIPYRLPNGSLLRIVGVDAGSGEVWLTEMERELLLQQVENWATEHAASAAP
jgi:hypothetical protein